MRTIDLAAAVALTLAIAPAARAADLAPLAPASGIPTMAIPGLEFEALGTDMIARSREYVYTGGRKLSQLTWRDASAYGVQGGFAVRFVPWLTLRGNIFFPLDSQSSMKDFDWIKPYASTHWSDFSRSPSTLTRGYRIDANMQADLFNGAYGSLGPVIGYQRQTWTWRATGGSFVYSVDAPRDTTGTFPSGLAAKYKQEYDAPYLGLAGTARLGGFKLTLRGYGSPYVFAHDEDYHAMRYLLFRGEFKRTQMLGGDVKVEYPITANIALVGSAAYDRYFVAKGNEKVTDYGVPGYIGYGRITGEVRGMDRTDALFSLGLQARM